MVGINMQQAGKKQITPLVIAGLAVVLFYTCSPLFYSHPEERHFLAATQKAFANGQETVKLSDLTDFDWDKVCTLLPTDNPSGYSKAELETWTEADWSTYHGALPDIPWEPLFPALHTQLGLVFIKKNKVVLLLAFSSPGFFMHGAEYIIMDSLAIPSKKYQYKYCRQRESAYLVHHHPVRLPVPQEELWIESK
jgi:hypothetical protein